MEPKPKDSFRYALWLVLGVALAAAAAMSQLSTDSADFLARVAVEDEVKIEAALQEKGVSLKGSSAFAFVVLSSIVVLAAFIIQFYYRTLRVARLEENVASAQRGKDAALAELQGARQQLETAREQVVQLRVEHEKGKSKPSELEALRQEFHAIVQAIDEVINSAFDNNTPNFKFTRINESTIVHADGAGSVVRDYEIEGSAEPARNWRFQIFADECGDDVDFLSEIDFRAAAVAPRSGETVKHLLNKSKSKEKEVTLFFFPPVPKGQSRRFRLTYRWPGYAADLREKGSTTFFANFKSCDREDTATITYEIKLSRQLGELRCTATCEMQGGRLVPNHDDEYWVWRYENPAMKVFESRLEFEVVRVDQASAVAAAG